METLLLPLLEVHPFRLCCPSREKIKEGNHITKGGGWNRIPYYVSRVWQLLRFLLVSHLRKEKEVYMYLINEISLDGCDGISNRADVNSAHAFYYMLCGSELSSFLGFYFRRTLEHASRVRPYRTGCVCAARWPQQCPTTAVTIG